MGALSPAALAQESTGNLYGRVLDGSGQTLPGATVVLRGIGAERTYVTSDRGSFRFLALDPGTYSLRASLEGVGSVEHPDVLVQIGRSTQVELTLVGSLRDEITVSAESPLLDERKVSAGIQVGENELQRLPSSRNVFAFLHQAPGVTVDRVDVGGNGAVAQMEFRAQAVEVAQNDWVLDGAQITDMQATGRVALESFDFDQLTEIQLVTGGTDASKQTAGVTVNLVTKRGGNEFRGSARFVQARADGFFGGALAQSEPDVAGELAPGQCLPEDAHGACEVFEGVELRELEEVGFEAGGRVVSERLWLWGSWGRNDLGQRANPRVIEDTSYEHASLKLNAQLSRANSAVASWNDGDKVIFDRIPEFARNQPSEVTTWDQRGPSAIYHFDDTHLVSSLLFVTGSYSVNDTGFELVGGGGEGPQAPESWQDASGVWRDNILSGAAGGFSKAGELGASYFFETGVASHELKVGGRFRRYETSSSFDWPGRNIFTYNTTFATFLVAKRGNGAPYTLDYRSAWAQDTIRSGRATFNVGVRLDEQSGGHDPVVLAANPALSTVLPELDYPGSEEEFDWTDVTPRLGATWAFGAQRETLLRASFSQFADQLAGPDIRRTNPAGEAYAYFFLPPCNCRVDDVDAFDDPSLVAFGNGYDPTDPAALRNPNLTDPAYGSPRTTEILGSVEHAFQPRFVGALNLTYRQVERIAEQRPLVRTSSGEVRAVTATDYSSAGFVTGTIPAVIAGRDVTYSREVFALDPALSLTGGSLLLTGSREREYLGAAVTVTRRLSDGWMIRGYVNYGEAEWRVDDEYLRNNDPNRLTGGGDVDGDLFVTRSAGAGRGERFYQSSWSANLNGMVQVAPSRPWGFNLSGNVQARQGHPLPLFAQLPGAGGELYTVGAVDELDELRLEDVVTVDLRLEKELGLPAGGMGLVFGIDAFNITNEGTALSRERNLSVGRAFFVNDTMGPRIFRLSARLVWR